MPAEIGKSMREALRILLQVQELDQKIAACRKREAEIPRQKSKFDVYRERLKAELEQCEAGFKKLAVDQKNAEVDTQAKQAQISKYQTQLNSVKKNDEYQALLHEIDQLKKQIGANEERIIQFMVDIDSAKERLDEDRKRIAEEIKGVDSECAQIDRELAEAVTHRTQLEGQRGPLLGIADHDLLKRYQRISESKPDGRAIVPLKDGVCGGCHMHERAQIVNEVMAGERLHGCQHCGRLLFYAERLAGAELEAQ